MKRRRMWCAVLSVPTAGCFVLALFGPLYNPLAFPPWLGIASLVAAAMLGTAALACHIASEGE